MKTDRLFKARPQTIELMDRESSMRRQKSRMKGHVAVEWVVVTLIVITALFVPLAGDNQSVAGIFMDSIRHFHENSAYLYSLP